jgi:ParB family chromosome partitioning protein
MKRKALGRGLGALIPGGGGDTSPSTEGQKSVGLDRIRANPAQPRKSFDEDELESLAASIRESGLMQPIVVRTQGDGFEIIAGERRWRAAQRAELKEVPIVIREASEREVLVMALVENLQRVDLNPIEEAEGYSRLAEEFKMTQDDVARSVGKDRTTVTNLLRLLKLAPPVQQLVRDGKLAMGHARAIAAIEDKQRQIALATLAVEKELSVRQVETMIREAATEKKETKTPAKITDPNLRDVIERLKRSFGTKVSLNGQPDRGRLVFEYYTSEEFERLLERLLQ